MSVIYYENDGDLAQLSERAVGVMGYGDLGRALALNLRDSGVDVRPCALGEDADAQRAALTRDHFPDREPAEVAVQAPLLLLALSDESLPPLYMQQVAPALRRGTGLLFTSAYPLAFGYVEPPPFVDVGLLAPRASGQTLRERYLDDDGVPSFVAVAQDASGHSWPQLLAVARGSGLLTVGAVEVSFEQEAELTQFVQQAVVTSFQHLMRAAAELLMDAGYPSEAVFTDLYMDGMFDDYLRRSRVEGLLSALQGCSLTRQYATLSRQDRFNELKLTRLMEVTLEEIRSGAFAKEWASEHSDGAPRLNQLRRRSADASIWDFEQQTLDLFDAGTEG